MSELSGGAPDTGERVALFCEAVELCGDDAHPGDEACLRLVRQGGRGDGDCIGVHLSGDAVDDLLLKLHTISAPRWSRM